MIQNPLISDSIYVNQNTDLYIVFELSGKKYSILASQIIEIIQLPSLTIVEKMPDHIVGLLNLRGNIISVVDLCKVLGYAPKPYSTEHQILIVKNNDKTLGIIVDVVKDVIQFDRASLDALPYCSEGNKITGVYKHDESLVAFLNLDIVMNNLETLPIEENNLLQETSMDLDLFPCDEASLEKFKKRALKLQKEIKTDIESLNYQDDSFISFSLNKENYCISLKFVKEITKLSLVNLTAVPCVPEFITGVINLRGEFITIVNIRSFLNLSKSEIIDKMKIIVVRTEKVQVGILVDDIFGIENILAENMEFKVQTNYDKNQFTLAEVILDDKTVINILDLNKLIEDEERLYIEDAI